MEIQQSSFTKIYLFIIALLGWFALISQFIININSQVAPTPELIIRYFSYFTILTNLLVAICSTSLLLKPTSKWGNFFSTQKTLTAITVYIVMVGLIYNLVLRFIWNPQGLQRVVDELLHSVIPLLFLFLWIFLVKKRFLKWNAFFPWLIYPLIYLLFILIRGAFSGFYPYPFIDVGNLGYSQVLIYSLGITIVFIVLFILFIVFGNIEERRTRKLSKTVNQ
ncbi:MAG: Pr6Pr family membrane protein [Ginsengibacter sp.]